MARQLTGQRNTAAARPLTQGLTSKDRFDSADRQQVAKEFDAMIKQREQSGAHDDYGTKRHETARGNPSQLQQTTAFTAPLFNRANPRTQLTDPGAVNISAATTERRQEIALTLSADVQTTQAQNSPSLDAVVEGLLQEWRRHDATQGTRKWQLLLNNSGVDVGDIDIELHANGEWVLTIRDRDDDSASRQSAAENDEMDAAHSSPYTEPYAEPYADAERLCHDLQARMRLSSPGIRISTHIMPRAAAAYSGPTGT